MFTYDEFLRVTQDNCGSAWGANYAYDLFGNMAKSTIAGSPGTSFQPTYNTSNHYATIPGGTPSYDGDGNLLNDSFHRYTWDNEGNPVTLDGNSMTYDALNRRVEYYNSSVGYVQYLWAPYDGTRNVLIVSSTGGQIQLPLPGGGQAMVGPSGVTEYRRANWQGSEPVDSSPSQTAIVDAAFTPMVSTTRRTTILVTLGATCRSIRSSWTAMRRRGGCTISIRGDGYRRTRRG